MRRDFHLHPKALQSPENVAKFIRQALEKGFEQICITDHMPLSLSHAKDRIPSGMVLEYCQKVREISRENQGIIDIRCGIEIDFHPSVSDEIKQVLDCGPFDYTLASSHMHIFIRDYENYSFNDFAAKALENSIQAAQSGLFSAISHLDMYRFAFENNERFPLKKDLYDPNLHKDLILHLFAEMKKRQMFLEINPHLAEKKEDLSFLYPQEIILNWALDDGVLFSYGSDAHKPESVGALIEKLENHPLYGKAIAQWEKTGFQNS